MKTRKLWFVLLVLGAGLTATGLWMRTAHRHAKPPVAVAKPGPAHGASGNATAPAAASVRPAVQAAVAPTHGTNFWTTLDIIHQLPPDLNPAEVAAIFRYLEQPASNVANSNPTNSSNLVLDNDLLNALHRQTKPLPELGPVLIQIFRDKNQDLAMRDYALQHLATWSEQMIASHETQPAWSARKEEVRGAFSEALQESGSGIAGTALINWSRLSQVDPSFDDPLLNQSALRLAQDPAAKSFSKSAALQVCCQRNVQAVLPVARDLAPRAGELPLRLSAIAAIGKFGSQADAALLKSFGGPTELRLQTAVTAAMKRIQMRLQRPSI